MSDGTAAGSTIDSGEVERFSRLAAEWWNPYGKFRVLHRFNPVRLAFIREALITHFGCDPHARRPFEELRVLDIGCGGGLICEPMARLGAEVVGADPARTNIEVARLHAAQSGVAVDYRETTAEALAAAGESFDVVLNLEVVEHVADMPLFISSCARMVRDDGLMVVATINRTLKAYALAIVGAERILGWLPPGTHSYDKLVRPDELRAALTRSGLTVARETGVIFNPLANAWRLSPDMDVNYMLLATKPGEVKP
jgi:2-polyprenyl-6-hydroxyphenyl methylase/3-demethylubiquinone-9 3-methyltransferase